MAWISVHEKVIGPKLRHLAKSLGCSQNEALGILVRLWLWAINETDRDGSLKCVDESDLTIILANGLSESISADDVIKALTESEWLEYENGIFYIHDWEDWQKQWYQLQDAREQNNRRQREYRQRHRNAGAKEKQAEAPAPIPELKADGQDITQETVPATTAKKGRTEYPENFEEFWKVYPRHEGKGEAYKKYKARLKDGYSEKELISAAGNYARRCAAEHTEVKYIKHAKTFLSDSTPFIDFLPKQRSDQTGGQADRYTGDGGKLLPSS